MIHISEGTNQWLDSVMTDGPLAKVVAFVLLPGLRYQMHAEGRWQGQETTKMTTPPGEGFYCG